jgi:hypothetical protein
VQSVESAGPWGYRTVASTPDGLQVQALRPPSRLLWVASDGAESEISLFTTIAANSGASSRDAGNRRNGPAAEQIRRQQPVRQPGSGPVRIPARLL